MKLLVARQSGCVIGLVLLALGLMACSTTSERSQTDIRGKSGVVPERLNPYVVRAVELLARDRARLGYASHAFTQDLQFGNRGTLAASGKPYTMCVAAQMEVLVEALNLQASEANDYRAFEFLPKSSWQRLRPTDLRGQVWIVEGAQSNGAADALRNFGMGSRTTFEQMQPGDFVNFNRTGGSGHGAIFMGYLDANGNLLSAYSDRVAGFKYFSSQGKGTGSGLDYRYAFFHPLCPTLSQDKKRDCGVIRSSSQRLLNTGFAWIPANWDEAKARVWTGVGRAALLEPDGVFDERYFTGSTTDE